MLRETLEWDLSRRREDRERDREVEARTLLAQRRGRQVDEDPALDWPGQPGGGDAGPYAVLRLLTRPVDEADDRERGQSPRQKGFDVDAPRLQADECIRDRAREHRRTLRPESSRAGADPCRMRAGSSGLVAEERP